MIVKVQRPIAGSDLETILVYGEGRFHPATFKLADLPDWLKASLRASPKVFAHADWDRARGWQFTGPAKYQQW